MAIEEFERWNALVAQYGAPPADGTHRFWMSVQTWEEEWEAIRFFVWQTGCGFDYRLKAAVRSAQEASHLPERAGTHSPRTLGLTQKDFDRLYVSNATVCMLVDAPDEDAAKEFVKVQFPDGIERFCCQVDDVTLETLNSGGRFPTPKPPQVGGPGNPVP